MSKSSLGHAPTGQHWELAASGCTAAPIDTQRPDGSTFRRFRDTGRPARFCTISLFKLLPLISLWHFPCVTLPRARLLRLTTGLTGDPSRMKQVERLTALPALLLLALFPAPALAQSPTNVGVVTTLIGQATVARAFTPQPLLLRFKDDVFLQDRISTAEKSLVRVLLGGKALVTVRELSTLALDERPGRATVDLLEGKIALGVLHSRMGAHEAIEIHTPNAVAAVRGTMFVVEILPAQAPGGSANTLITVARGLVGVTSLTSPGRPEVRVGSGQTYNVATGQLRTIPAEQWTQEFADLQSEPPHQRLPDEFQEALWTRELRRAAATASPTVHTAVGGSGSQTTLGDSALSIVIGISSALSGGGIGGISQTVSTSGGTAPGSGGVGCGGGVGGGAGVGCSGTGQGALNGGGQNR
jgi:FecR-like protein